MGFNTTISPTSYDDLLKKCWAMTDCWTCLKSRHPCGWCPVSGTCVPNEPPSPLLFPLLTPIFKDDICPHWSERWELRAKPMMCNVSTITFLSSLISILATITVIVILFLIILFFRCLCRRRQRERFPPHLLVIDRRDSESAIADERTSLLGRFRRRAQNYGSATPSSPAPKRRQSFWVYNTMPASAASTQSKPLPTPRQINSSDGSGHDDDVSVHDGHEGAGRATSTRSEWEERRRQLLGKRTNVEQ